MTRARCICCDFHHTMLAPREKKRKNSHRPFYEIHRATHKVPPHLPHLIPLHLTVPDPKPTPRHPTEAHSTPPLPACTLLAASPLHLSGSFAPGRIPPAFISRSARVTHIFCDWFRCGCRKGRAAGGTAYSSHLPCAGQRGADTHSRGRGVNLGDSCRGQRARAGAEITPSPPGRGSDAQLWKAGLKCANALRV